MKDLPATICRRANLLWLHSRPARSICSCPPFLPLRGAPATD